jgi:hypothetical protein
VDLSQHAPLRGYPNTECGQASGLVRKQLDILARDIRQMEKGFWISTTFRQNTLDAHGVEGEITKVGSFSVMISFKLTCPPPHRYLLQVHVVPQRDRVIVREP